MGLSRRSFLKLLSALPAAVAVAKVQPAFAAIPETPALPVLEIPSLLTRTSDPKLQLRFSDCIIDCLTVQNEPRFDPVPRSSPYPAFGYRADLFYSRLSVTSDYFGGNDLDALYAWMTNWMHGPMHGDPSGYKKPLEIWYEKELLATLTGTIPSSLQTTSMHGHSAVDFTLMYETLEFVNA